jgi:hypothetical protein
VKPTKRKVVKVGGKGSGSGSNSGWSSNSEEMEELVKRMTGANSPNPTITTDATTQQQRANERAAHMRGFQTTPPPSKNSSWATFHNDFANYAETRADEPLNEEAMKQAHTLATKPLTTTTILKNPKGWELLRQWYGSQTKGKINSLPKSLAKVIQQAKRGGKVSFVPPATKYVNTKGAPTANNQSSFY